MGSMGMTNFQGLSLSTTTPTIAKAISAVYRITPESIFTAQQAALHIYKTPPNSEVFFN